MTNITAKHFAAKAHQISNHLPKMNKALG